MKLEEKVGREKCYEWKIGEIGRDLESASVNGTAVPTCFLIPIPATKIRETIYKHLAPETPLK